jgi:hypothetical protein
VPLPPVDTRLLFRYATFDPAAGDPAMPSSLRSLPGNQLFVVQLVTDAIQEYQEALRRLGSEVS